MTFFLQFTEGVIGTPSSKFYRKKIGKKYRTIGAPNEPLQEVQRRIVKYLRPLAPRFWSAAACQYGLGAVRNARKHSNVYVFGLDFSDAFESVNGKVLSEIIAMRVKKCLKNIQAPTNQEWFDFLSKYALQKDGSLIRGAITSGLLFDWYCEVLVDKPIRRLLRNSDIAYTRYVDDCSFSANWQYGGTPNPITNWRRKVIRAIVHRAGFRENYRKTVVADLRSHGTVTITGVQVGVGGVIGIGRKRTKALEREITQAIEMPLFAAKPGVIDGKAHYLLDVLRGKKEINKLEARTLQKYIEWCRINGINCGWAEKTLTNKPISKYKNKKLKTKKT